MSEWRPIDADAKSGADVLLWLPGDDTTGYIARAAVGWWEDGGWCGFDPSIEDGDPAGSLVADPGAAAMSADLTALIEKMAVAMYVEDGHDPVKWGALPDYTRALWLKPAEAAMRALWEAGWMISPPDDGR